SVQDDRNIRGPYSVAVPGMVAGLGRALETFGTPSFQDILPPAIRLAEQGMQVDWFATLKIASAANELADFEHSRRVCRPHGFVPVGEWAGPLPSIRLGRLAKTLRRLADAGPADFYTGEIADDIVADANDLGIRLTTDDLAAYRPHFSPVERTRYRDAEIDIVPGLSAGPTLRYALDALSHNLTADT
ncbi:MAG: gamma-glutamyltransferase, partial [bacterium]|nr:gamma-glutamyltransferase [bacterium]